MKKPNKSTTQDPEKVIRFTIKNWYWISPLLQLMYKKTVQLIKNIKTRKKKT